MPWILPVRTLIQSKKKKKSRKDIDKSLILYKDYDTSHAWWQPDKISQ